MLFWSYSSEIISFLFHICDEMERVVVEHCNVIEASIWKEHPRILAFIVLRLLVKKLLFIISRFHYSLVASTFHLNQSRSYFFFIFFTIHEEKEMYLGILLVQPKKKKKQVFLSKENISLLRLSLEVFQLLEYIGEIILQIFLQWADVFCIHTEKVIRLCHWNWEDGITCQNLEINTRSVKLALSFAI